MIIIDGSQGEGGGQILRTSLALSLLTGQPFRIAKIRAGRKKPGLLRQHLTCVEAAAQVGRAEVEGNALGAKELAFYPNGLHAGRYMFSVGTAGSTSLVLQTILLPLCLAAGPSEVALEGGTHNPFAPPFPFLERAFLPLINQMGPRVTATLERHGFYPSGGGRVVYRVTPAEALQPLDLIERGKIRERRATALVVNLPAHIAERELKVVQRKLSWEPRWLHEEIIANRGGQGNVVLIEVASENITEVFTGFGERGRKAEDVAAEAVRQARRYLAHDAAAGVYLTDQLLLPLALAGNGAFTAGALSQHATTNIETIAKFLATEITVTETGQKTWRIAVSES